MSQPGTSSSSPSRRGIVPLPLAAAVSLVVPGLGHVALGRFRRGLLLFSSFATIVALLYWRLTSVARFDTELPSIVRTAFRLEPILAGLTVLTVVLYLWTALDAYLVAGGTRRYTTGLFGLIIVIFFGLGWQVGQIDPGRLVSGLDEGGQKLAQVMWPWERAIHREPVLLEASADIQIPCSDSPPEPPEPTPGEPHLVASPTCGVLSEQDGDPGSELTLSGSGFLPNERTDLFWEDSLRNEFRQRQGGEYITVTTDENGEFSIDIIMPYRLLPPGVSEKTQLWKVHARQTTAFGPAQPSEELNLVMGRMVETIFLGMMATAFGIVLAVPFSFLAARNLMRASAVTMVIYYVNRTVLNIVRSIEPLIWAVIAVVVVGLGPFAGILALTVHTIAALGKLYSEAVESIDPGPIEAIHATGANWVQTVAYGVIPQIIPPFVSFTIYRWDINVRLSTVIGLVGGGGIGFLLIQWIRLLDYRAAGIAVWFIAITVAVLDYVSAEIRERFV